MKRTTQRSEGNQEGDIMSIEIEQDRWLHVSTSTVEEARSFFGAPLGTPTRKLAVNFNDVAKRQRFAVFNWGTYDYDPTLDDKKHWL